MRFPFALFFTESSRVCRSSRRSTWRRPFSCAGVRTKATLATESPRDVPIHVKVWRFEGASHSDRL